MSCSRRTCRHDIKIGVYKGITARSWIDTAQAQADSLRRRRNLANEPLTPYEYKIISIDLQNHNLPIPNN